MDRFQGSFASRLMMVCLLVVFGVVARLAVAHLPNFAPVCGLALFAGFLFSSRMTALAVPIGVLVISDLCLGGYQPLLRLSVYGSLAAPIFLGAWIRPGFGHESGSPRMSGLKSAVVLVTCALGSSLVFFLVSNLATWWVTDWYPKTGAGLAYCFMRALPFFRYTLAGDLFFMGVLFGGYAILRQLTPLAISLNRPALEMRSTTD
jgi:hypothetical protein